MLALVLLMIAAGVQNSTAQTAAQNYAAKYTSLATKLGKEYGIPPALIIGVAIIESSCGQGPNCRDLNNHFGITGRNHVARKTRYKQYATVEDSYRDFCNLMTRKPFYGQLRGNMDVSKWTAAVSRAGYSEKPAVWQAHVDGVIRNNRL